MQTTFGTDITKAPGSIVPAVPPAPITPPPPATPPQTAPAQTPPATSPTTQSNAGTQSNANPTNTNASSTETPEQYLQRTDPQSLANFKAANPGLAFTAEDLAHYNAAGASSNTSGGTSTDTSGATTTDPNADALAKEQAQRDANAQEYFNIGKQTSDAITSIQNGTTPLTAGEQAQLDGLKSQLDQTVQDQITANNNLKQGTMLFDARNGVMQYQPGQYLKDINDVVSKGLTKVSNLQMQEAASIANLTQTLKNNDISAVKDAWSAYKDAATARTDALQKTIDDTQTAITKAQTAAQKAKDDYYTQVTKPIQDISTKAAEAGASADTIAKINGATSVGDAIVAAGSSIQTSTNPDIAQYLFYKQQATNSGQVPVSYDDYQKQQAQIAANAAYTKAYATAAGSAAGATSALPSDPTPVPTGLGGDEKGGSILAQTGLSLAAFNYLTQGTASMSRMTASQRAAIMGEAQQWLNKNNIDVSTFQSQYEAYNDVLSKNIQRANQTKVMAGEVTGSADALISAIDANGASTKGVPGYEGSTGMGSLKAANILSLMAGEQVNNQFAQTYKTQITFMANDLAGYLAAARGATSPELQDQKDAAQIIANGMNTGSVTAFRNAITANEEKVAGVVNNAVSDTQKQVWGLFGVADRYASPTNTNDALLQQSADNPLNLSSESGNSSNNPLGI